MKKILLVEDDNGYRMTLHKVLEDKGYEVHSVGDPISGLELAAMNHYNLVISDLVMDIMNGVRLLTSIQKIQPGIRMIILTAKPDEETEIESLDINIDYYLSKDRSISVILRYINEALNNSSQKGYGKILYSPLEKIEMNVASHEVTKNSKFVELTGREYQILEYFLKNKNRVITREEFIEEIWKDSKDGIETRVVDIHVKKVRDKLKLISIMSVRGYGYKWNE